MRSPVTRRRFLSASLAALAAVGPAAGLARAARALPPVLWGIAVRNVQRRYKDDRRLFATVAPGVDGRDAAVVSFHLPAPATVRMEAVRTARKASTVVWKAEEALPGGAGSIVWRPDPATPVGSYVMRLTVERDGQRKVYGAARPLAAAGSRVPVVKVIGVEAAFGRRSYAPGETMELTVLADAPALTLQFLRCGPETESTRRADEMSGVPFGDPVPLAWAGKRSAPATIRVQTGAWPTGVYAARLATDDGRIGFAPFVRRPATLGTARHAVVMPTHTWQAYNFFDADGDGWGDTWYAGGNPPVLLTRPYRNRGVPPKFNRYDVPFLRWLERTGHAPEFLAEDDLETIATGDDLRRLYDLVVFPGHTEYATEHELDLIERFRDLGGRLVFLSANNFFWRVDLAGDRVVRVRKWRDLGRPEARVLGVQYRANDDGRRQGVFLVEDTSPAPWFFAGSGLERGSTFGETVGGYGIEIDQTTADSPPGTIVLCRVPDLFGPGLSAEMSYYESESGARVFSAGVLDFCSSVHLFPQRRLLENVWRRMLDDVPPPPPTVLAAPARPAG
ncbi:MAG: hypothetical protein FJW96_00220 [Actinobacteria bacterium]|nr:hypothetical protein [Actinomycetota bacterium]